MAHASSTDALKSHMKKLRKQKNKAKMSWNNLGEIKQEEIIKKRNEGPSLKTQIQNAMYDIKTCAYPPSKFSSLKILVEDRLKEIKDENEQFNDKEQKELEDFLKKRFENE